MTIVILNEETWSPHRDICNSRNRRGIIAEIMYDSSLSVPEFDSECRISRHSNGSRRESSLVSILQATGCKRIKQSITEIVGHTKAPVSRIFVPLE